MVPMPTLLYGLQARASFGLVQAPSSGYGKQLVLSNVVVCFVTLSTAAASFIRRIVLYERWYTEPRGQRLVDLCSVANISIFIFTEQHKGYYIHGRSPYQFSDCSMGELLEYFRNEVSVQA